MSVLLDIRDLRMRIGTRQVLNGVNLTLATGEIAALVGASGSGKTMTAMSVPRLLPAGAVASGQILWRGQDVLGAPERAMQALRGAEIALIFQNAAAALNPIRRVGDTLADILIAHNPGLTRARARAAAIALIDQAGIDQPALRAQALPHQLSGGQCQRIGIACAIACNPALIIADEPTSALDTTVQQRVMDLLTGLCRPRGMALLLITHDLALAADYCDRALVMDAGRIVEDGPAARVFTEPQSDAARALIGEAS